MSEKAMTDNNYFISYEVLDVHKLMLEDEPRVQSYRNAIMLNQNFFEGKVVMDVGCGTGILSVFCAQAGAKKVYAIEASDVANLAKDVVIENDLTHIIKVIHSKVEDLVLPDDEQVDVIVSEWMGFFLLNEGMLDSVLTARDKFLKADGHLFPEIANIYIAPCRVPSMYEKWDDVFGVSMKSFARKLMNTKSGEPHIMAVKAEEILTEPIHFHQINLKTDEISKSNLISRKFLVANDKYARYQGLAIWFECLFPNLTGTPDERFTLNTGPSAPLTHWMQTVVVLPQEILLEEDTCFAFQLKIAKDEVNLRRYTIELTLLDPEDVEHPTPCNCNRLQCLITKAYMLHNKVSSDTANNV